MKLVTAFIKAHPLVVISSTLALWRILAMAMEDGNGRTTVFLSAALLILWGAVVLAFWWPLRAKRVVGAFFITLLVIPFCIGGVWVSMLAIVAIYGGLLALVVYLATLAVLGFRHMVRWMHHLEPGAEPNLQLPMKPAPGEGEVDLQPVSYDSQPIQPAPAINPRRRRIVYTAAGLVLLAIVGTLGGSWLNNRHQHDTLVRQLETPAIRYNIAQRTLDMVLHKKENSIRQLGIVYLYTQPIGITAEETQRLAQEVRFRYQADCQPKELPQDLHQMYLDNPAVFHLVLQPPVPSDKSRWSEPDGWMAMAAAYIAYTDFTYDRDTDAYVPEYLYEQLRGDRTDPTATTPLRTYYSRDDVPPPPTPQQQKQADAICAAMQEPVDPVLDPEQLPFVLRPLPQVVVTKKGDGMITLGTRCGVADCKGIHYMLELRWTTGREGQSLESLPVQGLWPNYRFYNAPAAKTTWAGRYPAKLLADINELSSQYQLLIQGKKRFYQLNFDYLPPMEHSSDSEKQLHQEWVDWVQKFVDEFEEK